MYNYNLGFSRNMTTNFIDTKKGLVRSRDINVLPVKGWTIKGYNKVWYIDEICYDLEKNECNVYMYSL